MLWGNDLPVAQSSFTGEITVNESGSFDFFLSGGDGMMLFVDGVEVVDHSNPHGYRTTAGEIELEPGTHEIEVRYYEHHGHSGLKLEWDGPGIDGRKLVQADSGLSVEENGTLDLRLSNDGVAPESTVVISGLPEDTILVSGDNSTVTDGGDVDLTGWDFDLIELMPPPGFEGIISAEVTISDTGPDGEPSLTSEVFEIEVGEVENAAQVDDSDDELMHQEGGTPQEGEAGWTDPPPESDGSEDGGAEDDVMDEPVTDTHEAEQSHDSSDTYERNDW